MSRNTDYKSVCKHLQYLFQYSIIIGERDSESLRSVGYIFGFVHTDSIMLEEEGLIKRHKALHKNQLKSEHALLLRQPVLVFFLLFDLPFYFICARLLTLIHWVYYNRICDFSLFPSAFLLQINR